MEKKMHKERSVRLPRIMGPVDRWQGKCVPTDVYDRQRESNLSETQQNIVEWIRDYYQEYIIDQHLVDNRSEPVLVMICEFPNFEGFESTAFNLDLLEAKHEEEGPEAVENYFRIPDPAHWEAGVGMNLEEGRNKEE